MPNWLTLLIVSVFTLASPMLSGEADAAKKKPAAAKKKAAKKKAAKKKASKKKKKRKKEETRTAEVSSGFLVNQLLKQGLVGARLGFDVSSMECDCDVKVDYSGSLGFLAGLSYDRSFSHHFAYRGHAAYVTKSYDYESTGEGGAEIERTTELSQVKLGGQLSLRYSVNPMVTVYIIGGPFLAFNASVRSQTNDKRDKEETDAFSLFDFGVTFGAGSYVALSKSRGLIASAELVYSNGLADRVDREDTKDDDDEEESGLISLVLGVHF